MRHWMEAIHIDERRGRFERPVCLTIDGKLMTVATNGRMLIAVADVVRETMAPTARQEEWAAIDDVLRVAPFSALPTSLSLSQLREFVGGTYLAPDAPCPECQNQGAITCPECHGVYGDLACACDRCDDEGEIPCRLCDGGWLLGKRVRIFGTLFNPALVAAALRRFSDESITWAHELPDRPALVRGSGWLALIMPMRDEFAEGDEPEYVEVARA